MYTPLTMQVFHESITKCKFSSTRYPQGVAWSAIHWTQWTSKAFDEVLWASQHLFGLSVSKMHATCSKRVAASVVSVFFEESVANTAFTGHRNLMQNLFIQLMQWFMHRRCLSNGLICWDFLFSQDHSFSSSSTINRASDISSEAAFSYTLAVNIPSLRVVCAYCVHTSFFKFSERESPTSSAGLPALTLLPCKT